MREVPALTIGSIVDMAGVARAKVMPAARTGVFEEVGAGVSPSWTVFCSDDRIAFTDSFSVVGDLRLRIDRSDLRDLGGGVSWAPATLHEQDGSTAAVCTRSALAAVVARLAADGLDARVGHEIEFTLFGDACGGEWSAYGLGAVLGREDFLKDLLRNAERAQLHIEQVHAEYGVDQFEMSIAPSAPVQAADLVVLARILISRTARAHGWTASFSPIPAIGGAGNGAHQHFSLTADGRPIFSGGNREHGMTDAGASALGGVLAHLAEFAVVFASSPLSGFRLRPDNWSGAYVCWGLENREAALRFCAESPSNPHGANAELKLVDPSANPYLATAAILGLSHIGIDNSAQLPPEMVVNPSTLTEAERDERGVTRVPTDLGALVQNFSCSSAAKKIFGESIVEALVSVKGAERETFSQMDEATIVERLRYTWS
ncbi:glutamine synthetase [Rhodococcus erythropolis]|uniref:glutamine synthetase family protein n=1 Tax=Rhodococcus erythropolis TaxID=1833 RepID=UPI001F3CE92A|nr:glutamine synthetase family protein [Rhodococcus erythropolis]UJC80584.1 glutamine synthetase [Rhodococcus erythropolis]